MHFPSETALNAAMRGVFRTAGLRCAHVKEADQPGPLDLIVWKGRALVCWIEVKLDDEPVRPSQTEFFRENDDCTILMRWWNNHQRFEVHFVGTYPEQKVPPYLMTWPEFAQWAVKLNEWANKRRE